jgi:hypothetical protein
VLRSVRLTRRDLKQDGASETIGSRASLGAIAPTRAAKRFTMVSLSLRAHLMPRRRCSVVVCPHVGPIEKRSPELDSLFLHQVQQSLPNTQTRPAGEGLGGSPSRTHLSRHRAPLVTALMPREDSLERAAKILQRYLALRPALLHLHVCPDQNPRRRQARHSLRQVVS